jgi:hypothetical protein
MTVIDFKLSGKTVTFKSTKGIFFMGVTIDDSMPINVPGANPDDILYQAQDIASKRIATQARNTMSEYFKKGAPKFKGIYWRETLPRALASIRSRKAHRVL